MKKYEKSLNGLLKNLIDNIMKADKIDVERIFSNYNIELKNSEEYSNLKKMIELINSKFENYEKEIKIISLISSNNEEKAFSCFEAENIKLKNKIEEIEKNSLKGHNQLIEDIKVLNERYLYDKILIDNLKNEVKKLKENPQLSHDKTGILKEISADIKDIIKKLREFFNIPIEINNDFYIDDLDKFSLLLKELKKICQY